MNCGCCGFSTIEFDAIAAICDVCFWQKDFSQEKNTGDAGGLKSVSLMQSIVNYKSFGVMDRTFLNKVRLPKESEIQGHG
ncbi:hypothetical protein AB669_09885 [Pedobacter sp. BMA]|nr:hypothetical protein AB669_09885 [Pedobacter sp. BMA]